ncbi:MAG: DinB family protein [Planctomycetota bacterium]|nr:DinB family protein [Planctomycetota bacterium]
MLERTPNALSAWLGGLPSEWIQSREKPGAWNALDIVGHLIHGEKTDWIPRTHRILEGGASARFEPFDRTGHELACAGKSMGELLIEFGEHRVASLAELERLRLGPKQLSMPGQHPDFGLVRLDQLLGAWAVHDLSHMAQIARAMARLHRTVVGPWKEFLPIVGPAE